MAIRFFKQSAALEDYDFDWSGWLVDGDFITSYNVTAEDGVTLGPVFHQSGAPVIKQFVGGGTHGHTYKVTCQITTDQGRSDVAQILILIRDYGTGGQPIPPPLEGEDMTIVTDITQQVTFPQPGVSLTGDNLVDSIIVIQTGKLVTLQLDTEFILPPNLGDVFQMKIPPAYAAAQGRWFAGVCAYGLLPPSPPNPAPNKICSMYINQPDWSLLFVWFNITEPIVTTGGHIVIAGQITYSTD